MKEKLGKFLVALFDATVTYAVAAGAGAIVGQVMSPDGGVLVGAVAAIVGHTIYQVKVRA